MSGSKSDTILLAQELQQVRNEVHDLEMKEYKISKTLETIRAELASRRARVDMLAHALAPINRIPSELLAEILLLARSERPATRNLQTPIEITALSVSRFWHATAAGFPSLWVDIHVSPVIPLARVSAYLQRSGGHKISVVVDCNDSWKPVKLGYAAVLEHFRRVRTLTLQAPIPRILRPLLKMLPESAPHLVSLDVIAYQWQEWQTRPIRLFPIGAPQLQRLRLGNMDFACCEPPLSHITTLCWNRRPQVNMRSVLLKMSALTRVELLGYIAEITHTPEGTVALSVSVSAASITGTQELLSFINTVIPSALTLRGFTGDAMTLLVQLYRADATSLRNLRTLELCHCSLKHLATRTPSAFVRAMHTLSALVIVDDTPEVLLQTLMDWDAHDEPAIMPDLRRLVLHKIEQMHAGSLISVVRGRAAAGVPIGTLVLPPVFVDAMAPDALSELREEVSLEIGG